MKVLLIKPPYFSRYVPIMPPLGLGALAAFIEQEGYAAEICDLSFKSWGSLQRLLEREAFGLVGITSMSENYLNGIKAARLVRGVLPEARIVMGGPHVSFVYAECLRKYPEVDYVVVGEGEHTLLELLQALEGQRTPSSVPGLAYREAGEIRFTGRRDVIMELDTLPFLAYEKIIPVDVATRLESIPVITSRGCPFSCSFCSTTLFWRKIRRNSNPYIMKGLTWLLDRYQFDVFSIVDDCFTFYRESSLDLCRRITAEGLPIHWGCSTRADCLDRELLGEMFKAGCRSIFLGVESLNPKTLQAIRKKESAEGIIEVAGWIKELGIRLEAAFILGLPGEDRDDMLHTIAEAKKLNADRINMGFLIPYPGTEIAHKMDELGLKLVVEDESFYSHSTVVLENGLVNAAELEEIWQQARQELPFTEWHLETRIEAVI